MIRRRKFPFLYETFLMCWRELSLPDALLWRKIVAKNKAKIQAERKTKLEAKAKAKAKSQETKKALMPFRDRIQDFIEEHESSASFEHARRMDSLLHDLFRAVQIGCEEAEKDLARIEAGINPCRPSELRQRLSDLLSGF